jgi:hypothetical protein
LPIHSDHVNKAKGNEAFADAISPNSQAQIDWKLVVLFYAALHYVEAYLAKQMGVHLRSHTTRDSYVSKESNLKKVRTQYGHLKFFSYNARYEMDKFTANDVNEATEYLAELKAVLLPLL